MGLFFGRGNKEERRKKKLMEDAIQARNNRNYEKYIDYCKQLANGYNSAEGALMLAKLYWNGEFAGEYNSAYPYFVKAIELGFDEAKELFEQFKEEAIKDSVEQFHIWFNTQGYEVAESYAKLAAKCGYEEANVMLEVVNKTEEIVRGIAIPYYNEAVTRASRGELSKEVLELFVRAAGMGLIESMCNAVIYYYELFFNSNEVDNFYTVYYPKKQVVRLSINGSAMYGNLRWIRKAMLAGNDTAIEWWYGVNANSAHGAKRCNQIFMISERAADYYITVRPDILPKLPVPDDNYVYPEGTVTYQSARDRLGI